MVFRLLAKEEAAEVFTDMNSDMREYLINALTDSELEEVMDEMYLDDSVDVLEEMPANVVDRLLMATDEETRKQINALFAVSGGQCRKCHEYRLRQFPERNDGRRGDFEDPPGRY